MKPNVNTQELFSIENIGSLITLGVFAYVGVTLVLEYTGSIFVFFADIIYYLFIMLLVMGVINFILKYIEYIIVEMYDKYGVRKVQLVFLSIGILIISAVYLLVTYTELNYNYFIDLYYEIFWSIIEILKR
ncbi:MAG: hypothetical protein ACOCZ5_02750 [bacterium]